MSDENAQIDEQEEVEKLITSVTQRRKEQVADMILEVLRKCIEGDLEVINIHYVQRRSQEIIENAIRKATLHSKKVFKAKKEFLDTMIEESLSNIGSPKTFKANTDATTDRDIKCEGLCNEIAKMVLNRPLLLSDDAHLKKQVEEENRISLEMLVIGYFNVLFDEVTYSVNESMEKANNILWDGKGRDKISFRQVDKVLKKA